MTPRIAICVVTYNSADQIEGLIQSLPAGTAGTTATLVVADNESSDVTVPLVQRIAPEAILVRTGANLGYAGGLNAAVAAAGEQDAYLIVNADVRLDPDCLLTLYEALGPRVGIAVPRLRDARGGLIWSMRREPTALRAWADALIGAERAGRVGRLGEVVTEQDRYESAGATDWAEGSTQLISAECWRACGPWDEGYFLYSEETDFDLAARDAGLATRFVPDAGAVHLEGGSSHSPHLWSLLIANRVRLYRKRHGAVATANYWLATTTREATRALLGKRTSRAALRDLLDRRRMREPRGPRWLEGVRAGVRADS